MAIDVEAALEDSARLGGAGASDVDAEMVELVIVHRKQEHVLSVPLSMSLWALRIAIQQRTYVPVDKHKLLVPANARIAPLNRPAPGAQLDRSPTLHELGFGRHARVTITLVGPLPQELDALRRQEDHMHRQNAPRRYHPSLLGAQPRNTTTATASFSPFGTIHPHTTTSASSPLHSKVVEYLTRLATDPAILHICQLHQFRVGALTELIPWEHPGLLGLNENAGERISLRIRTDDAQGFRDYKTTRKVLVHELAHNTVNNHPPEFKILNSKLNAQIDAFEKSHAQASHTFVQGDVYEPSQPSQSSQFSPTGTASSGHRLGGDAVAGRADTPTDVEQRRQRILLATMKRLEKEEHLIQERCGSGTPAPPPPPPST